VNAEKKSCEKRKSVMWSFPQTSSVPSVTSGRGWLVKKGVNAMEKAFSYLAIGAMVAIVVARLIGLL